jgi:hypothetical protein
MAGRFARMPVVLCALIILLPVHGFAAEPVHKPFHHKQTNQEISSTQALIEVVGRQVQENWLINPSLPGADKVHIRARVRLDLSGNLKGDPEVTAGGGPEDTRKALMASVAKSIFKAAPFKGLPRDRYNDWRNIVLNFDAAL